MTDREYRDALKVIEDSWKLDIPKNSPERQELDKLIDAVEAYEDWLSERDAAAQAEKKK